MKAIAIAGLTALALGLTMPTSATAPFDPFKAAGIEQKPGAAIPAAAMFRDSNGRTVRLGDYYGGRPIVLVPVYFNCPNICGTTLSQLSHAIDASGLTPGKDFELVAFSFAAGETPADASKAATRITATPIHLLTGPQASITAVTDALGFRYWWDQRQGQFAHASAVAILTRDGKLARWLYGLSYQPEDLRLAVVDAGAGHVGSLADRILLLCYHYDSATGRYGGLVWTLLRAGGLLTVAALVAFAALAIRRDRRTRRGAT